MIGFFFEALYDLEKKYLLQFGNSMIPMCIQFITLPLHICLVSLLAPRYGLQGIANATNISFFLNFVLLHLYMSVFTKKEYKFSYKINTGIKDKMIEYVKIGIPSTLMTYFDFWIYTILLFLSSYLGVTSNSA